MSLLHFATESYIVYRAQGIPEEVAFVKTQMETMKFALVKSHRENIVPTEKDLQDLQYINRDNEFTILAEEEFNFRFGSKRLRIVN